MLQSKKLFVSLLVVLALFTMSANATVSRLEGLGGGADEYWWNLPGNIFVLHDASTPAIWPQLIQQYPNLAGGEFGYNPTWNSNDPGAGTGWDLQSVYINYGWSNKKAALQFLLDKPNSTRFFESTGYIRGGAPLDPNGDGGVPSRLNATFGCKLGENLLFGANLSLWHDSQKDTTFEQSATVFGLKVGLSGVGANEWDAAIGIEMPSWKDDAGGAKVSENDGSFGFNAAGRYWWNYADKMALIPNVRVQMLTDGAKGGGSPTPSAKITKSQIGIGAGHNWWPVDNALVLSDFGIMLQKEKYEFSNMPALANFDETVNVLPYWRIGFESMIFSWLDGRLGAEKGWVSDKDSGPGAGAKPEFGTSVTRTFVGATAHWNRLICDLVVHPNFIGNGPNFISGNSSTMFTRVSMKYDFNK